MKYFQQRFCFLSILFVLSSLSNHVNAQLYFAKDSLKKGFISVHGCYGVITDHTSVILLKNSIGAEISGGINLKSEKTALTLTAGYTYFQSDDNSVKSESYIPLKAGVRQALVPHLLFLNADAGIGIIGNGYNILNEPNLSNIRLAADIGVGLVTRSGFEALLDLDAFREPDQFGYTGTVVLKVGWRF